MCKNRKETQGTWNTQSRSFRGVLRKRLITYSWQWQCLFLLQHSQSFLLWAWNANKHQSQELLSHWAVSSPPCSIRFSLGRITIYPFVTCHFLVDTHWPPAQLPWESSLHLPYAYPSPHMSEDGIPQGTWELHSLIIYTNSQGEKHQCLLSTAFHANTLSLKL